MVFGAALTPHIETTAIALLALTEDAEPAVLQGLNWLRQACGQCSSAYSLAWCALAFLTYQDQAVEVCIARLRTTLTLSRVLNIETLSLSAIAINAAEGTANPFQVLI